MAKKKDNKKSVFFDRSGWRGAVQIATILSGIAAVVAIGIALIALHSSIEETKSLKRSLDESVEELDSINTQMSKTLEGLTSLNKAQDTLVFVMNQATEALGEQVAVSGRQVEIASEHLTEVSKRPFLSLCIQNPNTGELSFSAFLETSDSASSFGLWLINAGSRSCEGGEITLEIPFLNPGIIAFYILEMNKIDEGSDWGDIYLIDFEGFGAIENDTCRPIWVSGDSTNTGHIKDEIEGWWRVLLIGLHVRVPDTSISYYDLGEYRGAMLSYKIKSGNEYGFYPPRYLGIYFDVEDEASKNFLRDLNYRRNLYDPRFR